MLVAGVIMLLFAGTVASTPELDSRGWPVKLFVAGAAMILFCALFLALATVITLAIVFSRKNRGVIGEHRLTITEAGLVETTTLNESLNRWAGLHKIVSTRAGLIIYVNDSMFHFVSRRRPLIEGDLVKFEESLKGRLRRT